MGIFHELITIVNRAPVPLSVCFDGQAQTIPVGESPLPKIVVAYAKNQNPVMGSHDADNPTISGGQYLVGVKGSKDNCTPLTKEEWEEHLNRPCRIDEVSFFADRLGPKEHVVSRGKGRKTQAKSSFDAGVRVATSELIEGRD
jgi:hypothetical protein